MGYNLVPMTAHCLVPRIVPSWVYCLDPMMGQYLDPRMVSRMGHYLNPMTDHCLVRKMVPS
jgi:hypothetical protein